MKGFPVVKGYLRSERFQPVMQSEEVIQYNGTLYPTHTKTSSTRKSKTCNALCFDFLLSVESN